MTRGRRVFVLLAGVGIGLLALGGCSRPFVSPLGVYADCGRLGDVILEGDALVAFTVFVQPGRNGGTELQVNAKMRTQAYRRGSSGNLKPDPVRPCVSTGRWEANLADAVRRLVKE